MSYINEIKAFYDIVQTKQISCGQISLWHCLMYINNKCGWEEWFTVPNKTLELNTGLSRSGVDKARNVLKALGLIDYVPNDRKATRYKLVPLSKSGQDSGQGSKQGSGQDSGTLNRLDETKKEYKEKLMHNFEIIWSEYPRKDEKQKAFKHYVSWIEGKKNVVFGKKKLTNQEMLDAVRNYNKYLEDNNISKQYTKMGSTFFNEGIINYLPRDEDDPDG